MIGDSWFYHHNEFSSLCFFFLFYDWLKLQVLGIYSYSFTFSSNWGAPESSGMHLIELFNTSLSKYMIDWILPGTILIFLPVVYCPVKLILLLTGRKNHVVICSHLFLLSILTLKLLKETSSYPELNTPRSFTEKTDMHFTCWLTVKKI